MRTVLAGYSVLKQLAVGPKADVLLAAAGGDHGGPRHVVIKRIRREHTADAAALGKYVGELRAVVGLGHKHVLAVHDVVQVDGETAVVMDYLHGEDLRSLLSAASRGGTRVPLDYALAIGAAVASGLHAAHERRDGTKQLLGIVHRNLSPSNILIGYDGSIKCTDFGALRRSPEAGGPAEPPGRVSYLSPEQCQGGEGDRRSDVYALGVVLYELATTTRLFHGSDASVIEQILHGRVPPPEHRRADLPAELSAIIMRAIAQDPAERYATCNELRIAIDQLAGRSGRASAAAIAGYLRDQFGERAEPWVAGADQGGDWSQDAETRAAGPAYSNSWTEVVRGGSRPIPIETAAWSAAPASATTRASTNSVFGELSPDPAQRRAVPARASVEIPVSADLLPAAPPPRPRRMALMGVPVALVAAVAVWKLASSSVTPGLLPTMVAPLPALAPSTENAHPSSFPPPGAHVVAIAADPSALPDAGAPAADAAAAAIAKTVTRMPEPPAVTKPRSAPAATHATAGSASAEIGSLAVAIHGAAPEPASVALPVAAEPAPEPPRPAVSPAPAPSAPRAPAQVVIAAQAFEANRIGGSKEIFPDQPTALEIKQARKDKIVATYKLCAAPDGSVSSVTLLTSTGFALFDSKIERTIRDTWRYRGFLVDGKPVSACSKVGFSYSPK